VHGDVCSCAVHTTGSVPALAAHRTAVAVRRDVHAAARLLHGVLDAVGMVSVVSLHTHVCAVCECPMSHKGHRHVRVVATRRQLRVHIRVQSATSHWICANVFCESRCSTQCVRVNARVRVSRGVCVSKHTYTHHTGRCCVFHDVGDALPRLRVHTHTADVLCVAVARVGACLCFCCICVCVCGCVSERNNESLT
jgi:hypothetical protein